MKTEIKIEPGICVSDEDKHKQTLADALHYAVNMLKEEGMIASTVSNVISPTSEELGREICRRVKDMAHTPQINFVEVKEEPVEVIDLEADFEAAPQPAKHENEQLVQSFLDSEGNDFEEVNWNNSYVPWDMKVKAVTLAMLYPKWSLETIRHKTTPHLRTPQQLLMWKQTVKKSTIADHYNIISDLTHRRFQEACLKDQPVTVRILKNWAMEVSRQFFSNSDRFKASDTWILKFQRKYNIRECKMTGCLKM